MNGGGDALHVEPVKDPPRSRLLLLHLVERIPELAIRPAAHMRAVRSLVAGEPAGVTFQLARNGGIGLVTVPAQEVTMGHYTATVTIPDEGSWTLIVNATGEGGTQTFHAGDLQIGTPLAPATPASPAAPVMPAWVLIAALVLLAAAAGIAGRIVATRRRSTVAPDRA